MENVADKKNSQLSCIKITSLVIYKSYQLMGINRSKSAHFIVLPLTFSPIFAN
jgi:hypothetical protein